MTFLLGRSVLVANVVEQGAAERTVYVPAGCTWYDMGDRLHPYAGGRRITVPVQLSSIPIFLRGDGIYVTTEDVRRITADPVKSLDILIGCEKDSQFVYYNDDSHTRDYERDVCCRLRMEVSAGECARIRFTREGSYEDPLERVVLRLVSKEKGAYWAAVDGRRLPGFLVREQWENSQEGWYYHLTDRTIWVKLALPRKDTFEVLISREEFNLIGMNAD